MKMDESRLVKKAIKGNKKAFGQLLKMHYEQIYRTAYMHVQNEMDALDVVQEATYQAFTSIHSLRQPEYFMTWFTRIIIRCSAAVLKKKKKDVPLTEDVLVNLMDYVDSSKDEAIELLNAVKGLKETYRTAIILFYYHDLSIKSISGMMDIPEGTVKTYLSRGKAALKKYLQEEDQCHG